MLLASPSPLGLFDLFRRDGVNPWSVLGHVDDSMAPSVGIGSAADRRWNPGFSITPRARFRRVGCSTLVRAAAGVAAGLGRVVRRIVAPGWAGIILPSPRWR